jgi:hypothetical protein
MTDTTASSGYGILAIPTNAARLNLVNLTLTRNGSATAGGGILIAPTGTGTILATLSNVRVIDNDGVGLRIDTTGTTGTPLFVDVEDSLISGTNGNGITVAMPAGAATGTLTIVGSRIVNNSATGIAASGPGPYIQIGDSTIAGNATGMTRIGGPSLLSFGDNRLNRNTTNGTFSGPDIAKD